MRNLSIKTPLDGENQSFAAILRAVEAIDRNSIEDLENQNVIVADTISSIQSLQKQQGKSIEAISSLFNLKNNKVSSSGIKNSPVGSFISKELKKQLKPLNDMYYSLRKGSKGSSAAAGMLGSMLFGKASGSFIKKFAPSLIKTLMPLLVRAFPMLAGGLALYQAGSWLGEKARDALGQTKADVDKFHNSLAMGADYMQPWGLDSDNSRGNGTISGPQINPSQELLAAGRNDRASRNINPGNVKAASNSDYLGQVGRDDKNHARFVTKEAGVAGLVNRLYRYNSEKKSANDSLGGKKTLTEIMHVFAPPTENATAQYIRTVARRTGIDPNQEIDLRKDPELLKKIAWAVMQYESTGHRAYSKQEFEKGIEIGMYQEQYGKEATSEKYKDYFVAGAGTATRRSIEGALSGNLNNDMFNMTQAAVRNNIGYSRGGHGSLEEGKIDCSGWTAQLLKRTGAPEQVVQAVMGRTAAEQIITTGRMTGTLQQSNTLNGINLKEGMLIGLKNNASRAMGIGHVGVIVRNPQTGELGVSHSGSSTGPTWEPLNKFARWANKQGGYVLSDPLVAQREAKKEEQKPLNEAKAEENPTAFAQAINPQLEQNKEASTGAPLAQAPEVQKSSTNAPLAQAPDVSKSSANAPLAQAPDIANQVRSNTKREEQQKPQSPLESLQAAMQTAKTGADKVADALNLNNLFNRADTSLKPAIKPVQKASATEKPLQESAKAEAAPVQPIIIQQPQGQKQEAPTRGGAGGSLPFNVDSPAVLAFQIDPTSPIHA